MKRGRNFESDRTLKAGMALVIIMVLYMSFDKFLLAFESRDLSQADMSNIRVSSFPKLCDG